ncbi:MAG: hypothetical protein CMF69_04900 [Magnetovibrio sp.]|nr:hypothetical protein [Magnetovibrio sp.]
MAHKDCILWSLAMVNKKSSSQSKVPKLSTAENTLWSAITATVKPLDGRNDKISFASQSSKASGFRLKKSPTNKKLLNPEPENNPALHHGAAPGLDRRTRVRLRRGQVNIEARLDLHGFGKSLAFDELRGFLERAYIAEKKSVLVITGKGLRRGGEVGVLRQAVPKWLNTSLMRQWIYAFDYAAPRDGGEGALYILMRRRRR